jgi:MinD superfamily P-loop ATPase
MAKGKYIFHHCGHCDRVTKMEIIGSSETQPDRMWYRCTRCRHASLVSVEELRKTEEETKKKLTREDASEYSPANTYAVGQSIFHSEWEDIGKIVSKEKTSRGESAIVVAFEKLGERRLLENVAPEVNNTPE